MRRPATGLTSLMHVADLRTALAVPRPKVSVPRRIDRAVARPRLLRGLTGAPFDDPDATSGGGRSPGPVVLLACAPAGYGKTTLLADYAEQERSVGVPIAWVTCDRDDDGKSFWSAVIMAATEAAPDSATVLAGLDADAKVKIAGYPGSSLREALRPKPSSQPAAASLPEAFGALAIRSVAGVLDQAQRSLTGTNVLWLGESRF